MKNQLLRFSFTWKPASTVGNHLCYFNSKEFALFSTKLEYPEPRKEPILRDILDHQFFLDKKIDHILVTDTLTLTFKEGNGYFLSLDAYTSMNNWISNGNIRLPSKIEMGVLILSLENNSEALHDRYPYYPSYEFDSTSNILHINFFPSEDQTFIQIDENIICSLDESLVSDFYLLNLAQK
jgi:hypothetical protein